MGPWKESEIRVSDLTIKTSELRIHGSHLSHWEDHKAEPCQASQVSIDHTSFAAIGQSIRWTTNAIGQQTIPIWHNEVDYPSEDINQFTWKDLQENCFPRAHKHRRKSKNGKKPEVSLQQVSFFAFFFSFFGLGDLEGKTQKGWVDLRTFSSCSRPARHMSCLSCVVPAFWEGVSRKDVSGVECWTFNMIPSSRPMVDNDHFNSGDPWENEQDLRGKPGKRKEKWETRK